YGNFPTCSETGEDCSAMHCCRSMTCRNNICAD
uniref:Conotoxin pr6d n=1 Tax=Conus parius TaxID=505247 RepID=O16D_CONPI|nr:RecName: Full=Conotoxin pr6d [Conus parius]